MAAYSNYDMKKTRESLKMSAADLAEMVSCDASTIYKIEAGKQKADPDLMFQIAAAFRDLNIWYMWMRTEYPASYGRMHPDMESENLQGAAMSVMAEFQDVIDMQRAVLKDAADGRIDDKALRAEFAEQLDEPLTAAQRMRNALLAGKGYGL